MRVVYLARLREVLGIPEEEISGTDGQFGHVADLVAYLRSRGGVWEETFSPGRAYRTAVNHELARPDSKLGERDEIAFFPPVTGG